MRFRRTHNRKIAKTPDLYTLRSNPDGGKERAKHSIQVQAEANSDIQNTEPMQQCGHNYSQKIQEQTLQHEQFQTHQNSMSKLEGGSVYQQSKQPAILIKQSAKSSVNESDMLGLLDMYLNQANLGTGRAQLIPSGVSNNLSMTHTSPLPTGKKVVNEPE